VWEVSCAALRQGGKAAGRQGGRAAGRQGGRAAGGRWQGGRAAGRQGGRAAGRQGGHGGTAAQRQSEKMCTCIRGEGVLRLQRRLVNYIFVKPSCCASKQRVVVGVLTIKAESTTVDSRHQLVAQHGGEAPVAPVVEQHHLERICAKAQHLCHHLDFAGDPRCHTYGVEVWCKVK
jgi:hypothetical protein